MSKTITGTWLYASGLPVVSGKLYLTLSQDAVVIGTGQVAPSTYEITLNASGQIPGSTTILANDELNPSGTIYQATVIAVGGGRVWGEQRLSISGASPVNINNLIPLTTPGLVTYGTVSFTYLLSGTNTAAAMVVGTGASLTRSGSGSIDASLLLGGTWAIPGAIGATTPNSGVFTTGSFSGQITSTVASSSPPFVITSTKQVPNLTVERLMGKGQPWFDVKAYGALGDGSTDDKTAVQSAITAAEALGVGVYFPTSTSFYKVGSAGFTLKRTTRITCAPGVQIKLAASSGTLFAFGSDTSTTGASGGIDYCTLLGNGGGADTSVAVQLGGTAPNRSFMLRFTNLDVSSFGSGFTVTDSDAFGWTIDKTYVHNNACNGMRVDTATATGFETGTISNSIFGSNGNGSATCTGLLVSASSGGAIRFVSSHMDNNGNGTLGQIHVPSTGYLTLFADNAHFEHASQVDSTHVVMLSAGANRSALHASNSEFVQNPTTALNVPIIKVANADLYFSNTRFTQKVAASVTPIIDLGAGVASQFPTLVMKNSLFACSGTAANCQILSTTGTAANTYFDITGSFISGFSSSTNPTSISVGITGCHDLPVAASPTYLISATRVCTGSMTGKRFIANGTVLVAGDFALSAGWGDGPATITGVRGNDQFFEFIVTSVGVGQGASPTITHTPHDGTWTTAPTWICQRQEYTKQPTITFTHTTQTATSLVLTFNGTPVAAETYKVACHTGGV